MGVGGGEDAEPPPAVNRWSVFVGRGGRGGRSRPPRPPATWRVRWRRIRAYGWVQLDTSEKSGADEVPMVRFDTPRFQSEKDTYVLRC